MKLRIIPIVIICILLTACTRTSSEEYSYDFFAMDTFMRITAYGGSAENGVKAAAQRINKLEKLFSVTNENSELYSVNHNGYAEVSAETAELISFALDISDKTDGALDPTVYPVLCAWGFTTDKKRVPSAEEISELLENVGHDRVTVIGDTVTLDDDMMIDLGAVAKGYAADEAERILRENSVTSALIDLGGNIQLIGTKPDGSDWRLGLKDPTGAGNVGVLTVSDCAVVTSGNYERSFTAEDGTVYGHIIDPKTGYPVDNGLLSVTIVANEGRLCDSLSTSLFVMGADKAIDFWRENRNFDFILITDNSEVLITDKVAEKFKLDSAHGDLAVKIIE